MTSMASERWQKIKAVLYQAHELAPEQRSEFLDRACFGEVSLRREVESLLLAGDEAANFLQTSEDRTALPAGTRLAHYEVQSLLGAGGMGEVYRGHDLRLGRDVAIKILPGMCASDPDRLHRFEQEARAAAALNHPNILAIYDVGAANEAIPYVVSELLEGETLRQCLGRGPLPVRKTMDLALQLASGLAAAHDKGIIHRDLKPENLFLTQDGHLKILDFGLAKLVSPRGPDAKTLTTETSAGVVMGTLGYIPPEQVRGLAVDQRSDIFAAGAIIYEMLSGKKAFRGETAADTLEAILNRDPLALSQINPAVPPAFERIVRRCLEKNANERFHSVRDVAFALEAISDLPTSRASSLALDPIPLSLESLKTGRKHRMYKIVLLGIVVFVTGALALWKLNISAPGSARVLTFVKLTNDGQVKYGPLATDGTRIYMNEMLPGPRWSLAQVSTKGGEAVALPTFLKQPQVLDLSKDGTELLLANHEAEGPDSLWIQPVTGGTSRRVGSIFADHATWGKDEATIIYSLGHDVYVVNRDGTLPRKLFSVSVPPYFLRFSPDGRELRFSQGDEADEASSIMEAAADGTNLHKILPGCCGQWTPDARYFVFEDKRDGQTNLWARREKARFLGGVESQPTQLTAGPLNFLSPTPSNDGKKLFAIGLLPRAEVVRYDSHTREFVPYLAGISAEGLAFSRDGEWVTYTSYPEGTLWRSRVDGRDRLQLTFSPMRALLPRWSPDGKEIVFMAASPGKPWNIYLVATEGGTPQHVLPDQRIQMDPNWSQDGTSLVFGTSYGVAEAPIYTIDLKSKRVATLPGSVGLFAPRWSPDGRYIVAVTAQQPLKLMLFDVTTQKWTKLYSSEIGYPSWSHDGKYIYFQDWLNQNAPVRLSRIRISDRSIETIVQFKNLGRLTAGTIIDWSGLAPDDSPLLARDISSQEVYALDWQAP